MTDESDPDESDGNDSDADPRAVRSLAVTADDVVAAYEARQRGTRRTVLRVTPPFSGRMRARLHEAGVERAELESAGDGDSDARTDLDPATGTLHVPPSRFVDEDAISSYPDPDETEDALRENPDVEFSVELHRERHVEAVTAWRESVGGAIVDELVLRLPDGTHEVRVSALGDSEE
ncbi:hypothetical protein [Halorussus litoreus]|uniref:hypothetical protein n=1 Tax=Halorussus litoreus TaxID=1710536 RepID=UPI000E26E487|nr:hypothetical protein [Halorussus litoreus]